MPANDTAVGYVIWGADHAPYGPVELPTLVDWIKDERVVCDTWLYLERCDCWEKAAHVPELQMFFKRKAASPADAGLSGSALSPAALRHIKFLTALSDAQLEQFVQRMEVIELPQGRQLVRQGEPADSMYLVVEGQLRAHMSVGGTDVTVAMLGGGDFFGEASLFDQGPRSADVIASANSLLLRVPANEFEKFVHESPDLAAPFLFALAKTLILR